MQLMRAQLVDSSAACGRVKADRTVADRHVLQRAPRELVHLCICQAAMSNLQKNNMFGVNTRFSAHSSASCKLHGCVRVFQLDISNLPQNVPACGVKTRVMERECRALGFELALGKAAHAAQIPKGLTVNCLTM